MILFEQIFFDLGPILFALAGFVVAIYVYSKKKEDAPMVCPLNGNCDMVTRSQYSKFLGIPVEKMGIFYYGLVMVVYGLHALIPWLLSDTVLFLMMGVTIGAFFFSLYLIFIQAFVLRSWCTWCLFSAGFSTFIFIMVVFGSQIDLIGLLTDYRTLIIVLHALAGAIGLGAATVSDVFFFKFLKDYRISANEHEMTKTLSNIIWFALGMIVVTGVGLFIPKSEALLQSSKFILKMTGVFVLIVNGVFLNLLISPRLMEIDFHEKHDHKKGELHYLRKLSFALGAISITSWYMVFILGLLPSIPLDVKTALVSYVLLLAFAITGSQLFDRKIVADYKKEHADNNPPPAI